MILFSNTPSYITYLLVEARMLDLFDHNFLLEIKGVSDGLMRFKIVIVKRELITKTLEKPYVS